MVNSEHVRVFGDGNFVGEQGYDGDGNDVPSSRLESYKNASGSLNESCITRCLVFSVSLSLFGPAFTTLLTLDSPVLQYLVHINIILYVSVNVYFLFVL